ncbi:MAG: transglutaminase N-terminal domain-containing protein [Lautropia sp.]
MKLSVYHATTYRYAEPAARSTQYIRLTPGSNHRQRVVEWQLDLPTRSIRLIDAFGNLTDLMTLATAHDAIAIVATGTVEVPDVDDGEPADQVNPRVFLRATALTEPDEAIVAFCEPMRKTVTTRPLIGAGDLTAAVQQRLPLLPGVTDPDTTAAEAIAIGGGAVQDQVHLFLVCCRHLGLPARYVSGYAYTQDRASVASRAWAEVWLNNRWVGFDVSQGSSAAGGHIKLAVGLDYRDASPVRGVRLGGGEEELSTTAQVRPAGR